LFVWQFCVPLIVCVFAYWKIWSVLLRQAKVNRPTDCQPNLEPVAGTSAATVEPKVTGAADGKREERVKGVRFNKVEPSPGSGQEHQPPAGQTAFLSQAKLNVIKTMIYIVVGFIICYMPKNLYLTYNNLKVKGKRSRRFQ